MQATTKNIPGRVPVALIVLFALVSATTLWSQDRYFVHFKDKPQHAHELQLPDGFDQKALQRRLAHDIVFPMEDDFPVHEPYIQEVGAMVFKLRFALRWPNAVSVEAFPEEIERVKRLPFVAGVEPFLDEQLALADMETEESFSETAPQDLRKMEKLYKLQVALTRQDTLWESGLDGSGVRIAVLDAGFKEVEDHPAFRRMRENGQLIEAQDFYKGNKPFAHSLHGTAVLGCIVGWWDERRIGSATGSEILLARTEFGPAERLREQDSWMAAAEWADQKGADIISSSLGYSSPLHTYAEMDGSSTTIAKAAAHAVRKGILVVNSAGNQGDDKFHFVSSPGDVDSVLTVGASYPMIRFPMPFSSFGPTASGVAKPNVCGPGYVLSAGKKGRIDFFSGTSFACPTVAGIAACLMQKHPEKSNMEVRQMLIEAGNLHPYYDYAMGHGVVDAHYLMGESRDTVPPTFHLSYLEDTLVVSFDSVALGPDSLISVNGIPFFFHIADEAGRLLEYRYLRVTKGVKSLGIPPDRRPKGVLRIWFMGYLLELTEKERP